MSLSSQLSLLIKIFLANDFAIVLYKIKNFTYDYEIWMPLIVPVNYYFDPEC